MSPRDGRFYEAYVGISRCGEVVDKIGDRVHKPSLSSNTFGKGRPAMTISFTTACDFKPKVATKSGGVLFSFAGLWENWKNERGEWLRSTTIITTEPNELCAPIHDRMPVILDPNDYARWLGEEGASQEELKAMLRPAPAELMKAFPVGAAVGNVKNNTASLTEPLPA